MGIDIIGFAMCCPPGMADPDMSGSMASVDMSFKVTDLSLAFIYISLVIEDGNAGRIITTVFKSFQAIYQKRIYITAANVTNNSTHNWTV
jgi:hypothetical protein